MSLYTTQPHILPHRMAPFRLDSPLHDVWRRTVVPPLKPTSTAPTTATEHHPNYTTEDHHALGPNALAHFLHAFHTHYGLSDKAASHDDVHHNTPTRQSGPRFDLAESESRYTLYGELPGLTQTDVTVETEDNLFTLTISGRTKRQIPEEAAGGENLDIDGGPRSGQKLHWHVEERQVGPFRRQFRFPAETVDMSGVTASMRDGLLCIILPKRLTVAEDDAANEDTL